MADDEPLEDTEEWRIEVWRYDRLISLGVSPVYAGALAADHDLLSWHDVEKLIRDGCPLATALEIVR